MKRFLCFIAVVAAFGASSRLYAQTLKVSFSDFKNDTVLVYLADIDHSKYPQMDTVVADNGAFEYTLRVPHATRAMFHVRRTDTPKRLYRTALNLVLVPGENVTIGGSSSDPTVTGTAFYQEYGKVLAEMTRLESQKSAVMAKYVPLLEASQNDSVKMKELHAQYSKDYSAVSDAREKLIEDYIKAHPNSEVATALIPELGYNRVEEALTWITPEARDSRIAPVYMTDLNMIKETRARETRMTKMEGEPAPTFTLNDINGKPLSLENLRGKYLILDFWGSWCGWCIKGMPDMKKAYAKHKEKLEILGIDCNDTEAKWKAAVKKHELPWLHVYCPNTSSLTDDYNITGYPTKVIIDPQGNIVRTIVGEDPEFYTFLDELLK